jgi:tripartite ATP-independent transporter DctM subunit
MVITTPALEITNAWRAAALPVGSALMLLVLMRLLEAEAGASSSVRWQDVGIGVLLALQLSLTSKTRTCSSSSSASSRSTSSPVCRSLLPSGLHGYLAITTLIPMTAIVGRIDEGMSHLILLSVPLFVFLGLLIEMTGMAKAMVAFLGNLLGHVRGGLHYVLVGSMYLVSGISGSKAADMAAIAPVLFPEMQRRGAKKGDLVALLSATGAQTETIPPSLVLLTIGSVTGVSIASLFTVGMLPAVVLGLTLCALVWWRYRNEDLSHVQRASGAQILRSLLIAVPAIALPFVIRAAVVRGVATATEVSTIGIAYSIIAGC